MKSIAIADLFCGAGGTSTGAVEAIRALGFTPKLTAINHWDVAIATHTENHPDARHLCTSIDDIKPQNLFAEGELEILWASPECTHHSVARGGKPINDQSRATAWCVVRWAEALRPNIILVENVPEFETWGGIGTNGRPLKGKRGATFIAWVNAIESLGYSVDWRVLCAADYGDPTTRRRLFVQAVRGRRKNVWPEPTHAAVANTDLFGSRKAWVPARDIIDWSVQGQSIYERKRPLSDKTMARIMAGLEKFGLKPFITPGNGERSTQAPRTHDVESPAPTVTAQGHLHLVEPFIVPQRSNSEPRSIDKPAPTVTTTSRGVGLAQPFLICMEHQGSVRSVDRPMPTITTAKGGAIAVAQPFLIETAHAGARQARGLEQPMRTVAGNRGGTALVQPFIVDLRGTADNQIKATAKDIDETLSTVSTSGAHHALIQPALLPQHQGGVLRPVDQPAPTIATDGAVALVEPFLVEYYGTGAAHSVSEPLNTVTTKDRHALVRPVVIVDGERYLLDIRFRMLQPKELAGAQGFRSDYKFTGNKSEQVKQIGNAVPRRLARALCLAVLGQTSNVGDLLTEEQAA